MSLRNEFRTPPLAAVRAFEAAARLGSFTAAAREIGLTQSAVSRHVRTLEDMFGLKLFERRGRAVALTVAGESYFQPISEGMALIRSASAEMQRRGSRRNAVTISLLPSVAGLWLAPRLADFMGRNPGIELRVHASRALIDLASEGVDVAIRYGQGGWPGTIGERLASETITPVCAPDFARAHRLDTDPAALRNVPLLADDLVDGWSDWFAAAGIAPPKTIGPRMDDSASLYHAAAAGLGVALGRSLLVARDLREGRLVAPYALCVPASYGYWLVRPDRGEASPATRLLMRWLREQMREGAME
jgi:LysR family glycine cleavage system transcriptional activator